MLFIPNLSSVITDPAVVICLITTSFGLYQYRARKKSDALDLKRKEMEVSDQPRTMAEDHYAQALANMEKEIENMRKISEERIKHLQNGQDELRKENEQMRRENMELKAIIKKQSEEIVKARFEFQKVTQYTGRLIGDACKRQKCPKRIYYTQDDINKVTGMCRVVSDGDDCLDPDLEKIRIESAARKLELDATRDLEHLNLTFTTEDSTDGQPDEPPHDA